jgi:hypothetical protein
MSLAYEKMRRRALGLCQNCGHAVCTCKIPKYVSRRLPQGIRRAAGKGQGK